MSMQEKLPLQGWRLEMQRPKYTKSSSECQVHQMLPVRQIQMLNVGKDLDGDLCLHQHNLQLFLRAANQKACPQGPERPYWPGIRCWHRFPTAPTGHDGLWNQKANTTLLYLPENKLLNMHFLRLPISFQLKKYINKFHPEPKGILKYQHIKRKK